MNQQENNIKNVNGNVHIGDNIQGNKYVIADPNKSFEKKLGLYSEEAVWKSPITMAILSWVSVILAIIGFIPFSTIFITIYKFFKGENTFYQNGNYYLIFFLCVFVVFLIVLWLRRITKRQIRVPLFYNYALNGLGKRLILEKIHTSKCPKCGGDMKYYNKPIEWVDHYYSNGSKKREITKRIPALECVRNPEHFWIVDPAEEKIK